MLLFFSTPIVEVEQALAIVTLRLGIEVEIESRNSTCESHATRLIRHVDHAVLPV